MTYEFYPFNVDQYYKFETRNADQEDAEDQMKDFEKSRIRALQQERILVQKKTFTKWCNSFLSKYDLEITNLFKDLEDGKRLIKLLEALSGEKLGKPNKGQLKVQKIENVNMALAFIQSKIKIESIGAEDIVAGNQTLILGLIWTVILRFQINLIEVEEPEKNEKRSAKEALLIWCQRKTFGYPGVKITDFALSWRNGLAFNALLHSEMPSHFDYNAVLKSNDNMEKLNHAFDQAQRNFNIPRLLDAEDIDVDRPDEKLVLTYVSSIYHEFAKRKNEMVGGKRIGKIIGFMMEIDDMKQQYETQAAQMLAWMHKTTAELKDCHFPNSLQGIQALQLKFNKGYMMLERPPKYMQKSELDALFCNINMKLTADGRLKYVPPEGLAQRDLELAWAELERAEHERELALKNELNRQEKLEQLYEKFDKKAKLREDWISEMSKILNNSTIALSTSQIDATSRKQEAIGADITARADRFNRLDQLAKELVADDYFSKEGVKKRNHQIQLAYSSLLDQYEKRKATLATFQELEVLFQEMESLNNQIYELQTAFQSKEAGEYLLAVESLLTKHSILESQIAGINQHLKSINRRAQQFTRAAALSGSPPSSSSSSSSVSTLSSPSSSSGGSPSSLSPNSSSSTAAETKAAAKATLMIGSESELVKEKLDALNKVFGLIQVLGDGRRKLLQERLEFYKFVEEADEEIMWVDEKLATVKSNTAGDSGGHDLRSTQILIQKHEQLEDEMKFRKQRMDKMVAACKRLVESKQYTTRDSDRLLVKGSLLQKKHEELAEAAAHRRSLLEDSFSSQQYFADANEAESWIQDKLAVVNASADCGKDEAIAQVLLQRHMRLQEEIRSYEPEVRRLEDFISVLVGKRRFSSYPADMREQLMKKQKRNAQVATIGAGQEPVNSSDAESADGEIGEEDEDEQSTTTTPGDAAADEEFETQYIEREVYENYAQEVQVPSVRALYAYKGKTFEVQRGEVLELKEKSNAEWWYVENNRGKGGFVPANYLKEIGLQKMIKHIEQIVKRPEMIRKPKTNAATATKKRPLRRKTTTIQPRQLQHLSTEELQARQVEVTYGFNQLLNAAIDKRKKLDNTITFLKWLRKYDELFKWVKERQQQMNIIGGSSSSGSDGSEAKDASLLENPDAAKRRYEAFNTDFLANLTEQQQLERLADELVAKSTIYGGSGSGQSAMSSAQIKQKQVDFNREWLRLADLKKYWDNAVKAIHSIEKYNCLYADVTDLLNEKLAALDATASGDKIDDASTDVRSVRALQSKQDKLERDLGPIETSLADLKKTADEVKKFFPQEKRNVQHKQELVDELWQRVRDLVRTRKEKLDEKHGLQRFENEVNDFEQACARLMGNLRELDHPRDSRQCEEMSKRFKELEQEFNSEILYKYNDLKQLSQKQLARTGVLDTVERINAQLSSAAAVRAQVLAMLDEKRKYLDDCQKYLKFKQDAAQLALVMQDQEEFLKYEDLGASSANVDALQKRHDEFMAKLSAQDEKMKSLADQAAKLAANVTSGPDRARQGPLQVGKEIERQIRELAEQRQKLKAQALERKQKLAQSKEAFEFRNKCDELNAWIDERRRMLDVLDPVQQVQALVSSGSPMASYQIEKCINKHEALDKEISSNRTRLDQLKEDSLGLAAPGQSPESLAALVADVERNWNDLESLARARAKYLKDAEHQARLKGDLSNADVRLNGLEEALHAPVHANDRRSAKEALKEHMDLQKQMEIEAELVNDLARVESQPSRAGSAADSADKAKKQEAVKRAVDEYLTKFKRLAPLLAAKQEELERNLALQELLYDIEQEVQWIDQCAKQIKILGGVNTPQPQSLFEAQILSKKHAEIERSIAVNHKPVVEKLTERVARFVESDAETGFATPAELSGEFERLRGDWDGLLALAEAKKQLLNACLDEQTELDQLSQIGAYITEKLPIIENASAEATSGKDDITLNKHVAKLNQLEHDLKGYDEALRELMRRRSTGAGAGGRSRAPAVARKFEETQAQIADMQQEIEARTKMLRLQLDANEFERDALAFVQWMGEKRVQAQNEDYGQDIEHLTLIKGKFALLKDEVRGCEPRYARLKKLCADLLAAKSGEAKAVRRRMDELRTAKELLDEALAHREQTLNSAAEIHRFNKDAQDLLRLVDDKEGAFGLTDLGRDVQTCETLARKHEIVMEELTALKAQLQELGKQSETLRAKHPGDTAESIAAEMEELFERFSELWSRGEQRSVELKQAHGYFRFVAHIRDVNAWMDETRRTLVTFGNIQTPYQQVVAAPFDDLYSVTQAQQEHSVLISEMTQRDDIFKLIDEMCIELKSRQHPRRVEIVAASDRAQKERVQLFHLWKAKNELLEMQAACHAFYKEAGQLHDLLIAQENIFSKAHFELELQQQQEPGCVSAEDVENLIKINENLVRKIEKQSVEKIRELKKLGAALLVKESDRLPAMLTDDIPASFKVVDERKRLETVLGALFDKMDLVREACDRRSQQLEDAHVVTRFRRDCDELEIWIDERIRYARSMSISRNSSSQPSGGSSGEAASSLIVLNEKLKLYQKQKALDLEIQTNASRFGELSKRGDDLLRALRGREEPAGVGVKAVQAGLVQGTLDVLSVKWRHLEAESRERAKEFEEAKDILEFNEQLDEVDEWLKEKELMLLNRDTGDDYEHCELLMKKAEETLSPSYDQKIQQVIQMGDRLVRQGRTDSKLVVEKKDYLLRRSRAVRFSVEDYKRSLADALEVHAFVRDHDDLKHRMHEKIKLLSVDTELATLDAVTVAQTKLLNLEQDSTAIYAKLDQLDAEAARLVAIAPKDDERNGAILARIQAITADGRELDRLLAGRKQRLESAHYFQKFMVEYRELKYWIADMSNRIASQPEPVSLGEAETSINLHDERCTEIDGKNQRFIGLQNFAREIIQDSNRLSEPAAQKEVQRLLKDVLDAQQQLNTRSQDKQKWLQECLEFQSFRESWRQLDAWYKSTHALLSSADVGDSVVAVKSLLGKHENTEDSVSSQMQPGASFDALEKRGHEMLAKHKFYKDKSAEPVQGILADLQAKRDELARLTKSRRLQLEDSLMFQNFLLNYYETLQWIKEKTASAMDKTYMDLLNLQTKIQRHQTFMNELKKSGIKRVEDVHKEARVLQARHQTTAASMTANVSLRITSEIDECLKDLDDQWNALRVASESKRKCLDDAYKCVLFTRQCDDLLNWCDEVEAQLETDDNGHDLSSCKMLILRHEALTREIDSQRAKIDEVQSSLLAAADNFMQANMQASLDAVRQRYFGLQEPCAIRKENLDESLSLFTILHDLDDGVQWVREKLPLVQFAGDDQLGSSLAETQALQKKHAQLEQETLAYQPTLQAAIKTTRALIERKHFAHAQLAVKLAELEQLVRALKDAIAERTAKLLDALEVQQYYADANQLVECLLDKERELAHPDLGKDELTSLSYQKKLLTLVNDVRTNQRTQANSLAHLSTQMQAREHYDKKNIARKQAEIEQLIERVLEASVEREQHLKAMLRIFEYERECEATVNWIKDQQVIVHSQDYGSDLEHGEALLKKFNEFMLELSKNGDRIARIDQAAQQLCENKYTPSAQIVQIDERCSSVNDMWRELSAFAAVRRQTLEGAIEIHAFDKDCDDLITWASEKGSFLAQEDIGVYELASSVFTLAKQQETLEAELTALKEELDRLNLEAVRLSKQYPESKEHIDVRLEDADGSYNDLYKQLVGRKTKIIQSQALFTFANEFNEVSEWLREMLARITSPSTSSAAGGIGGGEVNNAELLIKKNREFKIEIDLQQPKIQKFQARAEDLLAQARSASPASACLINAAEVKGKIEAVAQSNRNLVETWQSRQNLYEQNLEYNKLAREIKFLDNWLSSKDSLVHTDLLGDNVSAVDNLLKQHDEFESMLRTMEARFGQLKTENRLERTLKELKQRELEHRQQTEAQMVEEKKKEAERKRKLEKRRADDRRRTQEIIAIVSSAPQSTSTGGNEAAEIKKSPSFNRNSAEQPMATINLSASPALSLAKPVEETTNTNGRPLSVVSTGSGSAGGGNSVIASKIINKKDRNRTRSIRDKYKLPLRLPAPSIQDYLMRKQELQRGGQRAPIREYSSFYTTIHANLMCFFASQRDYNDLNATSQPLSLFRCRLNRLEDTTIQRAVLHLETADGAEYLFDAAGDDNDEQRLELWSAKILEASVIESLPTLSVAPPTSPVVQELESPPLPATTPTSRSESSVAAAVASVPAPPLPSRPAPILKSSASSETVLGGGGGNRRQRPSIVTIVSPSSPLNKAKSVTMAPTPTERENEQMMTTSPPMSPTSPAGRRGGPTLVKQAPAVQVASSPAYSNNTYSPSPVVLRPRTAAQESNMFVAEPQTIPVDYVDQESSSRPGSVFNRYSYDPVPPLKAASQERITRSEPRDLGVESSSSGLNSRQNTSLSSNTTGNSLGSERPVSVASEHRRQQELPSPPLRQISPLDDDFKKTKANGVGLVAPPPLPPHSSSYAHDQYQQYVQLSKEAVVSSSVSSSSHVAFSYQHQIQATGNGFVSTKVIRNNNGGNHHSPSNGTTVSSDGAYNRSFNTVDGFNDDECSAKEVVDDETSFDTDDHFDQHQQQQQNADGQYGIRNMVVNQNQNDKRSHTLPYQQERPPSSLASELKPKHSLNEKQPQQPKRNIFGSLFKKKKGKYDVKSDSTAANERRDKRK